ncbi:altronate hydrolase [Oceanidesulfovibrio marinus]|uniref:Altronate hydrolase n=2 Tax=Oceanidesulfovibrio marinus TaxID=370038 RepID=A0A6P1ZIL4_9BACT|nr:altronate hydrolase [Oceanidesulfovibrio marinus]
MQQDQDRKKTMLCLKIHEDDNIAIATQHLSPGERVEMGGSEIEVRDDIAPFHKMALRRIGANEEIIRYGVPIGRSTQDIEPGAHVHLHNMKSSYIPTYLRSTNGFDATPCEVEEHDHR